MGFFVKTPKNLYFSYLSNAFCLLDTKQIPKETYCRFADYAHTFKL